MPTASHREHEAKFQVDPDLLPSLQIEAIPLDGYVAQSTGVKVHTDTYLDTPAYDLLRHGLTLRVRQAGIAAEVGIKSLEAAYQGAIQDRLDVAIPLSLDNKSSDNKSPSDEAFDVAAWPATVREQLHVTRRTLKALRPLVNIRQHRQKYHLLTSTTNEPLAEWSLDEVRTFTKADGDQSQLAHFYELEIELLDQETNPETDSETAAGSVAAFTGLVAQVQAKFALTPIHTSKVVRGLEALVAHAHGNAGSIQPEMELHEACRLLLHQQLLQIMLNEHGARAGKKSSFVHDMRVALRRARAAMLLFGDAFQPGALTPYQKGLKRLGRALGAVRDLDVALANLHDFRSSRPENQRKGLQSLRTALKKRRARAHAKLLKFLDSKKYRKFIRNFDAFCTTSGAGAAEPSRTPNEYLPHQVRHTVPSIILRAFEAVRAYEVAFCGSEQPALATLHALRMQGKSLRYVLEFTQHLLGAPGESLIAQIIELLEHLGQLNDGRVEQERLHTWQQKMPDDPDLHMAIETRQAEVAALITELTETLPPRFATFVGPANRKRLATALARL